MPAPVYLPWLRAAAGTLWLFGPEKVFWTEDGEDWQEAQFR
jgi:hypothetical protein